MENLSDRELYVLCREYGAAALAARRRFAGLLPEVQRREHASLAKGSSWFGRRGYSCIYEFAARLAGMSRDQVNRVLQLERRFEDLPVLRRALVEGQVSINKLARVASIATTENQNDLLQKVSSLSKAAVEIYVQDQKISVEQDALFKASKAVPGHSKDDKRSVVFSVNSDVELMGALSVEVKDKLLELSKQGHNINEILMKLLEKREKEIEENLQEVGDRIQKELVSKKLLGVPTNRYIPVKVRRVVMEKFGEICSENGCNRLAEQLHHEQEFSKWRSHDPRFLRPLCRGHHELRHGGWRIPK